MEKPVVYIHLEPDGQLPESGGFRPNWTIVIADAPVSPAWRARISSWLVHSGCLYMMAYGCDCSSWDDSVDIANLEKFDFQDIPDDQFVMTTWHEDEPLSEVFWFAKHSAHHPTVSLEYTLLLHISAIAQQHAIMSVYNAA